MWYEKIIGRLTEPQIINDSKTPSGRVHVGSLRGVLIHDAIYRALKDKGIPVRYLYGIDDYDPMDGLPSDAEPWLKKYMGHPLCNIPAPKGSESPDMADHYISEFLGIFDKLGVGANVYRMRDIYRTGKFNEAIDTILSKADVVRKVYADVSNAERPSDWHPFQVVCEKCGKIGTTEVTEYDGKEVLYNCRPNLVSWAEGCGHKGKVSPFDGNGKLPWKLEWAAKWHTFGITIEGAGKDHCTKGGSRDVAVRCLNAVFRDRPPFNVPYEFFLVSGAKMSSSKGLGSAAGEMSNFLPPEILRFLMIRTPPKKTVNFSTDFAYIVKLFNEHDRLVQADIKGVSTESQKKYLRTIEVTPESTAYHPVGFQLLTTLIQLPHINIETEIEKRTNGFFTEQDKNILQIRIDAANYWLNTYASDEERIELQEQLPDSVSMLSNAQKAFLNRLGNEFPVNECSEDEYQTFIFHSARLTPLPQKLAFEAIYRVLFDKSQGPKGGSLFSYLDRDFLIHRFKEVTYSIDGFWNETGVTDDECKIWINKHKNNIENINVFLHINALYPINPTAADKDYTKGKGVIDLHIALKDGKTHVVRVLFSDFEGEEIVNLNTEAEYLVAYGSEFLEDLFDGVMASIHCERTPIITKEYTDKPIRFAKFGLLSQDH